MGYQRPSLIYRADLALLLPKLFLDSVHYPIPMPNIAFQQFSLEVVLPKRFVLEMFLLPPLAQRYLYQADGQYLREEGFLARDSETTGHLIKYQSNFQQRDELLSQAVY